MLTRSLVVVSSLAIVIPYACVSAQGYPNKPVRIVTSGVGGGNDFAARLIAQGLAGPLGQQVIVDNRSSGVIPGQLVSQATPDGHVLLLASSSLWIRTLLQENLPYDAVKDFSPVTLVGVIPNLLVVHPSLPVGSVTDLIALAKTRPGELNYGSGGTGSSAHVAAELFKAMASVDIVRVPYKSGASEMTDLLSGQVQVMFAMTTTVIAYVKSGRLRALAITSQRPSALLPGLPTVAASGVPGYQADAMQALFAPAKTATTVVDRLNREVSVLLGRVDIKQKFLNVGAEAITSSPGELAAAMRREIGQLSQVFKHAGIRAE